MEAMLDLHVDITSTPPPKKNEKRPFCWFLMLILLVQSAPGILHFFKMAILDVKVEKSPKLKKTTIAVCFHARRSGKRHHICNSSPSGSRDIAFFKKIKRNFILLLTE